MKHKKICFYLIFSIFFILSPMQTILFCHYHMYSTLTNSKLFCRLPHRCVIFYNIICNLHGSFCNIILQKNPPANIVFTMYAGAVYKYSIISFSSYTFNQKQESSHAKINYNKKQFSQVYLPARS